MDKELRRVIRELGKQGFDVRVTARQHVQVLKEGRVITVLAGTPSDHRSFRNALAPLKRAGFVWPIG